MTKTIVDRLHEELDTERLRLDLETRAERRHDTWVLAHLDDLQQRPQAPPACVVQARTIDDVVATVRACRDTGTALVPFGLGSGVCGGIATGPESVLLDLSAMDRTRFVDEVDLLAGFDAGKRGIAAENEVAARGLTLGHWPQSIELSSIGGWVATRASGQFSTGYGNIEDVVFSIEAVLPDGSVLEAGRAPRAAAGPDLRQLLLGSEGTLGVITGVVFSLRRAAEARRFSAFHAPDMASGFELQRQILQAGWQPCVMRLYDQVETQRGFAAHALAEHGLLLMVHEGPSTRVEAECAAVSALAREHGLGEAATEAVAGWMEHRNQVPGWEGFLNKGIILDTVEISATWSRIGAIYDGVVAALREVPDMLSASAHSSHVYRSGINLYFTFAARPAESSAMADVYRECWRQVMEITAAHGGGIAHHHGIGRVRRDYLHHDLGATGVRVLRTLKEALDPRDIMNPGVLLPERDGGQ